ncbi:MAG: hypothetical protein ABID04_02860, partial [Patescibacteria group bacterium]
MNILGHPFVACTVLKKVNWQIVAGSILPDIVPFVPQSVFSFEEIHENPERFLFFLEKNYPSEKDLALGMMTHSVKFGADRFSPMIEKRLLGTDLKARKQLANKIVDCSGVSLEMAQTARIHNYLWAGFDVYLLKQKSDLVEEIRSVCQEIDQDRTTDLLAEWAKKDRFRVRKIVAVLFDFLKFDPFASVSCLVSGYKSFFAGLPEKDALIQGKTERLFEEIYQE